MTNIDRQKLEESIQLVQSYYCSTGHSDTLWCAVYTVLEAAKVTLSTLPKMRTVEVECWVVLDRVGEIVGLYSSEDDAVQDADTPSGNRTVVRLADTAKVPA